MGLKGAWRGLEADRDHHYPRLFPGGEDLSVSFLPGAPEAICSRAATASDVFTLPKEIRPRTAEAFVAVHDLGEAVEKVVQLVPTAFGDRTEMVRTLVDDAELGQLLDLTVAVAGASREEFRESRRHFDDLVEASVDPKAFRYLVVSPELHGL